MKLVLFIRYYFSKKLTCVFLCHKDLKKHLLIKVNIKKFSEQICRQLKYQQHRIRSKTGISLEIILNVFKCLIVLLVPLKLLLWQWQHFCLFQLASSVNLLWCQVCIFYCPLRKKRYILLSQCTDVHIQQHIHKNVLNLCLPLYYYGNVVVKLEKHKQGIQLYYWCL